MARDRDDHAGAAEPVGRAQEGQPCRGRRLAEQSLLPRELEPGGDDLLVGGGVYLCAARVDPRAVRGSLDANRARKRVRTVGRLDRVDGGVEPELRDRLRVRGRVTAAAVGQHERVRCAAELLDDLEHGCPLAGDPVRIEGVDEHVIAALAEHSRRVERLVEAAAHREHARPECPSLDQLPAGSALGHEHERL